MSTDFKWDDKLVIEFASWSLNQAPTFQGRYADVEQFKKLKQPSKDYEILAYKMEVDGRERIVEKDEAGKYNLAEEDLNASTTASIFRVKRLSDGLVLEGGDDIEDILAEWQSIRVGGKILRFIILTPHTAARQVVAPLFRQCNLGKIAIVTDKNEDGLATVLLSEVVKCEPKKPLYTTVDGVDLYDIDSHVYALTKDLEIAYPSAGNSIASWLNGWYTQVDIPNPKDNGEDVENIKKAISKRYLLFSSEEAAQEYILMHKPILSLQDILDAWSYGSAHTPNFLADAPLFKKLKNTAKQKLK